MEIITKAENQAKTHAKHTASIGRNRRRGTGRTDKIDVKRENDFSLCIFEHCVW